MAGMPDWLREWLAPLPFLDIARLEAGTRHLYELLLAANAQFNLTRIDSEEGYWSRHIADSLTLPVRFPALAQRKLQVADIGCGAGFPSLVLALACPEWRICAIDSIGKKTNFVRAAAETLELHNLEVVTGRSRELDCKPEFQNRFDVVTARAVAPTATLAMDARRFPKRGSGRFIFFKTPQQLDAEWDELTPQPKLRGLRWQRDGVFQLPHTGENREFVYSLA